MDEIAAVMIDRFDSRIPMGESDGQLEIKLEILTADMFSQICSANNSVEDQKQRTADKFYFALTLKNYIEEMKENADTSRTTDGDGNPEGNNTDDDGFIDSF